MYFDQEIKKKQFFYQAQISCTLLYVTFDCTRRLKNVKKKVKVSKERNVAR